MSAQINKGAVKRSDPRKKSLAEFFSEDGVKITPKLEELITFFRRIKNTIPSASQTGRNALFVAENSDRFPDKEKAKKMGYVMLYTADLIKKFVEKLESERDVADMEEFAGYVRSAAFNDFFVLAWRQCRSGDDSQLAERYEILCDAFKPIARKYGIKILPYAEISQKDSGVDDIKKIRPSMLPVASCISKKEVAAVLARYLGEGFDAELEGMLKMPPELFMEQGASHYMFYESNPRPIRMLKALFGGVGTAEASKDAGYGLMLQESPTHTYLYFIDTSRRVAVKATVYSMQEGRKSWEHFKEGLKTALAAAGKIQKKDKKAFLVYDLDTLKKLDLSKL